MARTHQALLHGQAAAVTQCLNLPQVWGCSPSLTSQLMTANALVLPALMHAWFCTTWGSTRIEKGMDAHDTKNDVAPSQAPLLLLLASSA